MNVREDGCLLFKYEIYGILDTLKGTEHVTHPWNSEVDIFEKTLKPEEIIIQEVNNTTYKNKYEDEETNYIWGHNYIDIICSDLKIYNYTHISD